MARGYELPSCPPSGGHRGPLYVGDLYRVCKRAAYRSDFRFVHNTKGIQLGAPPHCCGLNVGPTDKQSIKNNEGKSWLGAIGNVKMGMVPEWTVVEDVNDPDSEIYAIGWRLLLKRWLTRRIIAPTDEVKSLLGPDFYRYLNPKSTMAG